jgi:hypothetical protein
LAGFTRRGDEQPDTQQIGMHLAEDDTFSKRGLFETGIELPVVNSGAELDVPFDWGH